LIKHHQGRVVDTPGDNILAEFSGALNAVNSAIEIQQRLAIENENLPSNRRMEFRIGINLGDVLHKDERIYGDGVNIAARIESLADPGGISISRGVFDQVKKKVRQGFEYMGEHEVKNISEPVRIYRVLIGEEFEGKIIGEPSVRKTKLNKPYAIAIALLFIFSGGLFWYSYQKQNQIEPASIDKMALPLPDKPSIVVFPFKNLSDDANQDYFCDGLTMDIIASLSKVPDIFVIARDSTFSFKGNPLNIKQVAEKLGVRYVLHGRVFKSENRIRITAFLTDAIKGNNLWAERYDRDLKDTFALQDDITMNVLTALQVELTEGEKIRVLTKSTDNLDAYQKWMKGRDHFLRFNIEDNLIGRRLLEEAISLDPKFTSAYVDLAWTHIMEIYYGASKSPKDSVGKAYELAQKAVNLDPTSPFALSLLGAILTIKKQYKEAIAQGVKAVSLSPNYSLAHAQLGRTLMYAGQYEDALRRFEKSIRLDPIPKNWFLTAKGICLIHIGKYEEAVKEFKTVIDRNPKDLTALIRLTMAYSLWGREEDARATAEEVLKLSPNFSVERVVKQWPYKNEEDRVLGLNALRKAGLPD
jgi:adenylate cyclase